MSVFRFKQFNINQAGSAMKIGTDAMILGAFIAVEGKSFALDIGTGTGVLSLMAAQRSADLKILAIDIEAGAAAEATENFRNSPFHVQIEAKHIDFLQLDAVNRFDLIFSNPPYFERSSKSGISNRDLARHDDSLLLQSLFRKTTELLTENGHFWLILPHATMDQYLPEAISNGLFPSLEIQIFGKPDQLVRKIVSFSKQECQTEQKALIVRNSDGTYTKAYKQLTEAYHFNQL